MLRQDYQLELSHNFPKPAGLWSAGFILTSKLLMTEGTSEAEMGKAPVAEEKQLVRKIHKNLAKPFRFVTQITVKVKNWAILQ